MNSYAFLKDTRFLKAIDSLPIKEQVVRITALSWGEEDIQEIQGKVISGAINLNGASSLRRTCNITLFAEEYENDLTQINTLFSINRKIRIELGIKNKVSPYTYETLDGRAGTVQYHELNYTELYGDTVWFPLGIYVIFDPNITHSVNGVQISLTLKDKMCLLNGDAGGVLPAAVQFHKREREKEDGSLLITYPTMRQIIQEAVNHFGEESLPNIIIEDLPERVKQVLQYNGNSNLYYVDTQFEKNLYLKYDEALGKVNGNANMIKTIEKGENVGFIYTDFTYPGELISNAGETVTSVLDKIVSALGNFEYFYDVFGRFHFQEIKNYLNTTYTSSILAKASQDENYEIDLAASKSVYTFDGTQLIETCSNAPRFGNIKNDFVVWGVKKSLDGSQTPIRYHLAIDARPQLKQIDGRKCYGVHRAEFYIDKDQILKAKIKEGGVPIYTKDWREELYYQGLEALDTATNSNYYFVELINEWAKLYDLQEQKFKDNVRKNPSRVDFFLDIIDDVAGIGKYSVKNIGRRSISLLDEKINCVFEDDIPDIVFICKDIDKSNLEDIQRTLTADQLNLVKATAANEQEEISLTEQYYLANMRQECDEAGQDWIQVKGDIFNLFSIGGYQNSCFEKIKTLLYQNTNMGEQISISALPIFYLEPNTRISVADNAAGVNGDYMINSISLPLDINSMMSISATKCVSKL